MQHEVGTIVEGKVTGITKFGAFVELPDGAVGMVHISEVSQTYVNDIADHLKEQQVVKVKILSVNDDGKISLSIKKALPQTQQSQGNRPSTFTRNDRNDKQFGNNNGGASRGNFQNNQNRSHAGTTYRPPQSSKPTNFEDMLSKFIQSSDEKNADLKREKSTRRGGGFKPHRDDYD